MRDRFVFVLAMTAGLLTSVCAQTGPLPIHIVSPNYPELARQAQIQGIVHVFVHVDAAGTVASAESTTGQSLLREEVERNLEKWRFTPGKESTLEMIYEFRLDPPKVTYIPIAEVTLDLPNKILIVSHAGVPIMDGAVLKKKK